MIADLFFNTRKMIKAILSDKGGPAQCPNPNCNCVYCTAAAALGEVDNAEARITDLQEQNCNNVAVYQDQVRALSEELSWAKKQVQLHEITIEQNGDRITELQGEVCGLRHDLNHTKDQEYEPKLTPWDDELFKA